MKYDIVWHEIITATGNKSIMFQTNQKSGFMFIDSQRWCDPCKRICAHFGFISIHPNSFGEVSGHPVINPKI